MTGIEVTREELNPCTVKLDVRVGEDGVRHAFDRAYKQLAKRVRVPGFRPGHAPRAMVEKHVSKTDVYEIAADNIVRSAFKTALTQESLEPHSQPSLELTKLDEEKGECEFVAKVPLAPKVELGDYKGLTANRPAFEVSDEEIEHQVEDLRRRKSTREAITDRGVQEGDVAVVNVKIEGETGDGRNFMILAGQTFAGLDAALLNMKAEEMKGVELSFPENFQEKDWAGKTLQSKITLRSLSAVTLPQVDDSFAQSVNAEGVDDLRTRIRQMIQGAKENTVKEYVTEQLLEELLKRSTIHVPDTMWESVASRRLGELEEEQKEKGKTMEDYAAEKGMTIEKLVESWGEESKLHVMRAVMVREIFSREKFTLSNVELNNELVVMAAEYSVEAPEMLNLLKKNQALDELHFRAIFRKVTDFLLENANVKEEAARAP